LRDFAKSLHCIERRSPNPPGSLHHDQTSLRKPARSLHGLD